MEPENNIEMIIKGYLASGPSYPLFVIGNITNKFGKYITKNYSHPSIKFSDAIYNQSELDNLRYYSSLYFHGHSVGGTNPSLLEAMACGCRIAAHNNKFNRAVLQGEADYFPDAKEVSSVINTPKDSQLLAKWKKLNLEKIQRIYDEQKIIDEYEAIMLDALGQASLVIQPSVAEAV
jgi:glycosyltransferase involved in cell wall biosynthesis